MKTRSIKPIAVIFHDLVLLLRPLRSERALTVSFGAIIDEPLPRNSILIDLFYVSPQEYPVAMPSAVDLKNEGNKAFSSGDYPSAVDLYSKAIELDDKQPLFYTNRAQVRPPIFRLYTRKSPD